MMDYTQIPHYWVNHLGFLIRKTLAGEFAANAIAITPEEWAVLLILQHHQRLSPSALSDKTMRDRTTITRTIDKMVTKGLVARQADQTDRRVQNLSLTPQGHDTFARAATVARAVISQSVDSISKDDLAVTLATLSKMSAQLSADQIRRP